MIAIDNILISDEIVQEQFVCDLNKCKGGCCVDGDAGAPLNKDELQQLNEVYDAVLPYLPEESKMELQRQGKYVYDKEFGWVTPTIASKVCVYGITDKKGIVKCGIEKAWQEGQIAFQKPISCHLYPIRTAVVGDSIALNYEEWKICQPACACGESLDVPVFRFLKEPLIRAFGEPFYNDMLAVDAELKKAQ